MSSLKRIVIVGLVVGVGLCAHISAHGQKAAKEKQEQIVQAQVIFTVSESKRLIAKAVVQMPIIKEALKNGMVIVCKGTTCTYVAEEILGRKIPHGAYVFGRTYPVKGGRRLEEVKPMNEVVLINGKLQDDMSLAEAVKKLKVGDVVIKGANALDYERKLAAGIVSGSTWGTTGTIMPYISASKANLVVPVGLEKEVAGDVVELVRQVGKPVENINWVPSMFLFTGEIVTEIEALKLLCGVETFQVAAGGIGGAEGSVRLICRGARNEVHKALKMAEEIQGEPPFAE